MTATLLLVDGDPRSSRSLGRTLELEGYRVLTTSTGQEALRQAATGPDLVLLADTLPDFSTTAACRRLRDATGAPIFILSSRHQETEKVLALDAGADDYVTRPYGSAELLARIRAALRRMAHLRRAGGPVIRLGSLAVDLGGHRVTADGASVELTQREFAVLRVLVEHRGQVVTRQRLLWAVWGSDFFGDEGILDVYIHALRKKIEPSPVQPAYLTTVRGVGYRLDVPAALRIAS
jgi:two-component system KDP operon response regulator KdpE